MTDQKQAVAYTPSDVAERLKVSPITIRKYTQALEEKGYQFKKDHRGWRSFSDNDIKALDYFSVLRERGSTIEEAAETIGELYRSSLSVSVTDIPIQDNEFKDFMEKQEAFNKELLDRLDRQQKYIENSLNERDEKLLNVIREMQETKKLLAAAQEEKEPPKKWWQFWK